jgi:hypothetical protein
MKHNMPKDLYQSKKIIAGFGMNCDTECMDFGRSRYVKVVNEDGASITMKVAVKQLRYMSVTPRLI